MGSTFGHRRGGVAATFDEGEADLLRHLLTELLALLDEGEAGVTDDPLARAIGIGTATARPADPALARLFPDGYADDEAAAADFRRYTEAGLREGKRADARAALATLDRAGVKQALPPATALSWLRTLNDLRLTLGTRLDVTEETSEEDWESLPVDDPRSAIYAIYSWLGWLQETLVRAM